MECNTYPGKIGGSEKIASIVQSIKEGEHLEIIENYDYWSVPSLFIDHDKIFEAALFMPYETVKEGVKAAFDRALEA
jgi:hypothetical protein